MSSSLSAHTIIYPPGAIDVSGNVKIKNTIEAKTVKTEKLNIATNDDEASTSGVLSASAGIGTITRNTSSLVIKTTAVTKDSLIYVTFSGDYSPAVRYWTDTKIAGKSFTIKLDQPVSSNAKFNWWIVN